MVSFYESGNKIKEARFGGTGEVNTTSMLQHENTADRLVALFFDKPLINHNIFNFRNSLIRFPNLSIDDFNVILLDYEDIETGKIRNPVIGPNGEKFPNPLPQNYPTSTINVNNLPSGSIKIENIVKLSRDHLEDF